MQFQAEHRKDYVFVQLSMIEDGEPGNASVEVLLVLIVESILRAMKKRAWPPSTPLPSNPTSR